LILIVIYKANSLYCIIFIFIINNMKFSLNIRFFLQRLKNLINSWIIVFQPFRYLVERVFRETKYVRIVISVGNSVKFKKYLWMFKIVSYFLTIINQIFISTSAFIIRFIFVNIRIYKLFGCQYVLLNSI
jgi:hypothetical protein